MEEVLQALWSLQDTEIHVFVPEEKEGSLNKTAFAALRNSPIKTARKFVAKATPEPRNPASSSQAHVSQVGKNPGIILWLFLLLLGHSTSDQQVVGLFAISSSGLC